MPAAGRGSDSHPPAHMDDRSSLPPPVFFCQLLRPQANCRLLALLALECWARVVANGGHCNLVHVGGQEAVPCAYIPPACQPRKSQLLRLPGAAKGSAVLAEAPQRRSKREPPESLRTLRLGVLLPALPTTSWSPSSAFRNGVGCVSTEVNIHWSLWLFSWHRVRREAGTAHRSGEPARPPPASAPSA